MSVLYNLIWIRAFYENSFGFSEIQFKLNVFLEYINKRTLLNDERYLVQRIEDILVKSMFNFIKSLRHRMTSEYPCFYARHAKPSP